MKLGNNLDFGGYQSLNQVVQNLGAAPSTPVEGQLYYNSTNHTLFFWNGTAWQSAAGGVTFAVPGASAVGDVAAQGVSGSAARADHTHGREAFAAPAAQTTFGIATVAGTALTVARSDHNHGTPVHDNTAHAGVNLSGLAAPATDVSWGNHKITSLLDPTNPQDAVTKNYADTVAQGLSAKGSAVAGTVTQLPSNTYANGVSGVGATLTATGNGAFPTVDGVSPILNQTYLVKNETNAANNGKYVLTQVGSGSLPWILTRAADMDAANEYVGAFVFVEQGTINASTGWVVTTVGAFTPGTTAVTWTQFSGAGTYTAGSGLTLTGAQFSISAAYVGQASITTLGTITTGVWNGTAVPITNGGTGGTTAAAARANLGATTKVSGTLGDGASTSFSIVHALGTQDVTVAVVRAAAPFDAILVDWQATDATHVTIVFGAAPAVNAYRYVIVG